MRGGERQVSCRMPVLREDDVAEMRGETIDERHDLIATWHGQCAVGTEVVLDVDHDKDVVVADCVILGQIFPLCFLSATARDKAQPWRMRLSTFAASLIRSSPTWTG